MNAKRLADRRDAEHAGQQASVARVIQRKARLGVAGARQLARPHERFA